MEKKSFPLSKVYQLLEPGPVVMVSTSNKKKINVMTLSWQSMIDFEPPLLSLIMGEQSLSHTWLKKSKECVINIPTVELLEQTVAVGNCSGRTVDKFKKFHLTPLPGTIVKAPLIKECYANLECKVIDASLAKKYNLFILEVVKAWVTPQKKRAITFHHTGTGSFIIDGKLIEVKSKMK